MPSKAKRSFAFDGRTMPRKTLRAQIVFLASSFAREHLVHTPQFCFQKFLRA
jgi:hypothetical protein